MNKSTTPKGKNNPSPKTSQPAKQSIGQYILLRLEFTQRSLDRMAHETGLNRVTLQNLIDGKLRITHNEALVLAAYFCVPAILLYDLQEEYENSVAPETLKYVNG